MGKKQVHAKVEEGECLPGPAGPPLEIQCVSALNIIACSESAYTLMAVKAQILVSRHNAKWSLELDKS